MEEKKVTKVAECKFTGYLLFQTETPINRDFRWFDFLGPTHSSGCHRGLDLIINVEYSCGPAVAMLVESYAEIKI